MLDSLERDPRVEVVAALSDPGAFVASLATADVDITVACPEMIRRLAHPSARPSGEVFVVAAELTVPVLREAIDAGVAAVFGWPEERDELADAIARTTRRWDERPAGHGRIIAVCGGRGGAGTTFIATHLAAAFASRGASSVLMDLDFDFAGVTVALGVGASEQTHTVADLVPVLEELSPEHVHDALFRHPRGFALLLAPGEPAPLPPGLTGAALALLAHEFEVVVLHMPRALDASLTQVTGVADDAAQSTSRWTTPSSSTERPVCSSRRRR